MSIPINWFVLFFFILLAAVFFLVYEVNSKFKWRMRALDLEEEIKQISIKAGSSTTLTDELNEALQEIKDRLTDRQFEIFIYAMKGLPSKEISEILSLNPTTVDTHIRDILRNLDIQKRAQLPGYLFNILTSKTGVDFLPEM